MSKSDPSITINPRKVADLEFEVVVNGTDDNKPDVRFVIEDANFDRTFKCNKGESKNSWRARIPVMSELTKDLYQFRVEIVVDGYFFAPAKGTLALVQDPTVKFQTEAARPSVSTSFTVKQIDEAVMPVAQNGGELSPTNQLLSPEYDPSDEHGSVKVGDAEKYDQFIDMDELSSHVVPGETTDPEPQEGQFDSDGQYDARSVAQSIVRNALGGSSQRPETKGTLFARDPSGKAVIRGIDTPEAKAAKGEKAARVKEILRDLRQ